MIDERRGEDKIGQDRAQSIPWALSPLPLLHFKRSSRLTGWHGLNEARVRSTCLERALGLPQLLFKSVWILCRKAVNTRRKGNRIQTAWWRLNNMKWSSKVSIKKLSSAALSFLWLSLFLWLFLWFFLRLSLFLWLSLWLTCEVVHMGPELVPLGKQALPFILRSSSIITSNHKAYVITLRDIV